MREPLALPELPSDLPDPLVAAIRSADLEAVWAALGTLPRRQRRALVLRELGGLSYHELGRALGVSHSAVESLLFRARRQVRVVAAGANVAAAQAALRDQLAQLIPGFDPSSAGAVARIAALPLAFKLAGAAVGVGVVATGVGEVHRPAAVAAHGQHRARESAPVVTRVASRPAGVRLERVARVTRVVPADRFDRRRHRRDHGSHEIEAVQPEPEHGETRAPAAESLSEGPGPAPATTAATQVQSGHDGPGGGGSDEVATQPDGDDHSGSGTEGSSSSDGGSGHSGPG
jgi:hypothetical protein